MAQVTTTSIVGQIGSLFAGGSVTGLSDRQLIERFIGHRDPAGEAAFAALVARHGPMVLGVCRQLLGDRHHAEDAFQATFLVLARKARSIHDPDRLANWLYGVALRTARKARCRLARRRQSEESGEWGRPEVDPGTPADEPIVAREQAEVLHGEIGRLPVAFRLPVVLCYFEGLTVEEAARQLQWPHGTVRSRLARARDKLRLGLTRRGVVLPAAVLAAGLSPRSASASVSSSLCDITTKAAIQFAAGQAASPLAASLAQEVLRAMFVNKLRLIATTLLLLAAVATSAGYFTRSRASQDEPKRQPAGPRPQVAARPDDTPQHPAAGRMFVVGRVLDPKGKPVANAMTMVYAAIKQPGSGSGGLLEKMRPSAIGQARSDDSGRFQIDAPRTSSSRHHRMGAAALAPGYGPGWVELDADAEQPVADITLRPEQVIQGRLFDLNGRPVQGVTVSVAAMLRILQRNSDILLERTDGPTFSWAHVNDLPAWPKAAISDAEGRFTVHGAGRDLRIDLNINDPRFAQQRIQIYTDGTSESKPMTMALEPAKVIRGRITEADTGKPIPHAQIVIVSYKERLGMLNEFEADAEGRFRANPLSGDRYEVSVTAPDGQPRLSVSKLFNWPKAAVEYPIDLALPRGVVIRGKVTEEGSGKPVAGARISFGTRRTAEAQAGALNSRAASGPDGSFQIAVFPSPGYLVVLGSSDDYVLREIGSSMVFQGKPGGSRYYVHGFLACDPKPAGESLDVNVVLRRGMTVNGRVVGPDGQPIQDAWMISRVCLFPSASAWLSWRGVYHGSVKSGQFKVHGLDPDTQVPVYFLDPHHKLGATINFSGKSAAVGPFTVRLQPCGTAKARLVDTGGKPIAGYRGSGLISMVVTPGPNPRKGDSGARLVADVATLTRIDSINYKGGPVSDALGRIAFPALVPGATYRGTPIGTKGTPLSDEFTVKPGETLDLGDIVIEKSNRD